MKTFLVRFVNWLLEKPWFQAATTFGTFSLSQFIRVRYGDILQPVIDVIDSIPMSAQAFVDSLINSLPIEPNTTLLPRRASVRLNQEGMELYNLRPFEGWQRICFTYTVQLNGRPWVSNALLTVDHTHLDGPRPFLIPTFLIEPSEYEYNALNDIYSHLINNENIDAVISNLRDAL